MKKIYTKVLVTIFALILLMGCAGQGINLGQAGEMFKKKDPVVIEALELENLLPSITEAFAAAEAARRGELKSLPFVAVNANSRIIIDEAPTASTFKIESMFLTNYNKNLEGSETLGFLSGSADRDGRKDRRIVEIVYNAQQPNTEQTQAIKAWLLKQNNLQHTNIDDITRQSLIGFQKENGLTPDGQFGSQSAESLVQNMPVINVEKLESHIFYPEIPNHMVFILPYEVFKKNEAKLSQGFESLLEVGELGISADQFKEMAKEGQQYILFVYFFDRVDPTFAINVGFSATKKQWDSTSSSRKKYYAAPDSWPVIAEIFTIDSKLSDQLYFNIFLQEGKFKFKCVGSHKLM